MYSFILPNKTTTIYSKFQLYVLYKRELIVVFTSRPLHIRPIPVIPKTKI